MISKTGIIRTRQHLLRAYHSNRQRLIVRSAGSIGNQSLSTSANSQSSSTTDYVDGPTTHFGFQDVPIDEKEKRVLDVFKNVADNYDLMNDLMSGGLHRFWKDELLTMTGIGPTARLLRRTAISSTNVNKHGRLFSILDVAGGTGDVAFRFLEEAQCIERAKASGKDEISITVCDINKNMLEVGEKRARSRYGDSILDDSQALIFKEANAQQLPFEADSFNLYTIAFGLRNVTDVDIALTEAYRVLKPGGRFLCLEFSKVTNPALAAVYDSYSFNVIPAIGHVVANDRSSYQYLVESIRKFCDQHELKSRLENAGFTGCKFTNMTGGIVAVHEGWKPL